MDMMDFLACLGSMSLQAVLIICVVLFIRKIFFAAHVSKKYVLLLWVIPFFFLVFPWKLASPVGFWAQAPSDYGTKSVKQHVDGNEGGQGGEDIKTGEKTIRGNIQGQEAAGLQEPSDSTQENNFTIKRDMPPEEGEDSLFGSIPKLPFVFGIVWLAGAAFLVLHGILSYVRLRRTLCCSINEKDNVYYADGIQTPMVLGIFRARIYIPSGIEERHLEYVVAHENTHIRRKDFITKIIAYFISCIHWFNPLVWAAYVLMVKDMEMACDEETLQRLGMEKKKEYADALLQVSAGKRRMFVVPLAFGEGDTKKRIKNVMRYQKNVKLSAAIAIIAAAVIALVFLTKAEADEKQAEGGTQEEQIKGGPEDLTLEMVRDAFENQTIDEIDFHDYANGEEEHFEDGSLNYYINFYYEYEGEEYRLGASHSEGTDALENIDITRASDSEMGWLYTAEDGKERYMDDLETFFATKNNVEDWLTLELPKGYSLGSYQAGLGDGGGALISPKAYEIEGDGEAWVPAEWQYSGFVGRIPNAGERFFFHNGKLDDEYYSMMNHSSGKTIAVLDDLDCPVIFARYEHDLYTAADMAELEEQGIEPDEAVSSYWYFYFVREGEEEAYCLTLSTKEFSKEEALAVAGTVKVKYPAASYGA